MKRKPKRAKIRGDRTSAAFPLLRKKKITRAAVPPIIPVRE
jgi:hypothetical protein